MEAMGSRKVSSPLSEDDAVLVLHPGKGCLPVDTVPAPTPSELEKQVESANLLRMNLEIRAKEAKAAAVAAEQQLTAAKKAENRLVAMTAKKEKELQKAVAKQQAASASEEGTTHGNSGRSPPSSETRADAPVKPGGRKAATAAATTVTMANAGGPSSPEGHQQDEIGPSTLPDLRLTMRKPPSAPQAVLEVQVLDGVRTCTQPEPLVKMPRPMQDLFLPPVPSPSSSSSSERSDKDGRERTLSCILDSLRQMPSAEDIRALTTEISFHTRGSDEKTSCSEDPLRKARPLRRASAAGNCRKKIASVRREYNYVGPYLSARGLTYSVAYDLESREKRIEHLTSETRSSFSSSGASASPADW
ncbi:Hypothetical predicted protein [Cloeon dipterum]|uniref:Uncharacterized protein n=1 Tax=Cloeon dipterum TaxID=197152 RepID=A0A8S1DAN2_9INSE|nr:Hypothetical predicted protein [Cloeon dipterum]